MKKRGYIFLNTVMGKNLFSNYWEYVQKCNRKKTEWVRILLFPTATRDYGYKKKWFEEIDEVEFEGYQFMAMKDKEVFLSFAYGDYWELPSEEQRKIHPVSEFELGESLY